MTLLTLYGVMPSRTEEIGTLDVRVLDNTDVQRITDSLVKHLTLKPEANTFFRTEADDRDTKWDLGLKFTPEFLSTADESQIFIQYLAVAHAFLGLGHLVKADTL